MNPGSNDVELLISLGISLIFGLIIIYAIFIRKRKSQNQPNQQAAEIPRRGRLGVRRRQERIEEIIEEEEDYDSDMESLNEDDEGYGQDERNMTVAERREMRRQERQARRNAMNDAQFYKNQKQEEYDAKRREKEEKEEERERLEKEELERKIEERRKKEEEEAAKWAEFISVEQKGEIKDPTLDPNFFKKFTEYIKHKKVIPLDELSAEFEIKTKETIKIIEDLEKDKVLTGIMDERGKYIYISIDEMKDFADYIKSKGIISIAELAKNSDKFINLESFEIKP